MSKIDWTPEKQAKAKRLRSEGMAYRPLAKKMGVSHGAIRYKLNPHHRELCLQSAARHWRKDHPDCAPYPTHHQVESV